MILNIKPRFGKDPVAMETKHKAFESKSKISNTDHLKIKIEFDYKQNHVLHNPGKIAKKNTYAINTTLQPRSNYRQNHALIKTTLQPRSRITCNQTHVSN